MPRATTRSLMAALPVPAFELPAKVPLRIETAAPAWGVIDVVRSQYKPKNWRGPFYLKIEGLTGPRPRLDRDAKLKCKVELASVGRPGPQRPQVVECVVDRRRQIDALAVAIANKGACEGRRQVVGKRRIAGLHRQFLQHFELPKDR